MKFTVNRKELLEIMKTMVKVIPSNHLLMELEGFLIEYDEDTGYITITGTNLETSIQRKLKVSLGEDGSFVINARLFLDISSLLVGENITVYKLNNGRVIITSGKCKYTIPTLDSKNYPKPEIPFPDDTIKVTGICDLYSRTANAAATNKNILMMSGIHLDISPDSIRAVGFDSIRLATSKKSSNPGGKFSVTIPKTALGYLAGAVKNDDILDTGICDKSIVFMKEGFLFTSRIIEDNYIDTDNLLAGIDCAYTAKVDSVKFAEAIEAINVATYEMKDSPKMNMKFSDGEIKLFLKGDISTSEISVPADVVKATPKDGFYYNPVYFADCFKTVSGMLEVNISSKGIMLLKDASSQYMILNVRRKNNKKTAKAA